MDVAGELDGASAALVLRFLDSQCKTGRELDHIVLDVTNVSAYDPAATEQLCAGLRFLPVPVALAGCSSRFTMLPLRGRTALSSTACYPSTAAAVQTLLGRRSARSGGPRRPHDGVPGRPVAAPALRDAPAADGEPAPS
ncbi:hypothetical protein AFB00_24935 [Pseudonocardia sp. HH130630-07]|nr:hypothetical protein AFB00_24935 [Pseudonocardia sp. HH130630-07]